MKRKLVCWLAVLLLLLACAAHADSTVPSSVASYNGKRIGVLTGTLMEGIAKKTFPDSEYLYLNNYPDCITALLSNKIDAFLGDEPGMKTIHAQQPKVDFIKDRITSQDYSFAFRKDDPASAALCAELNVFLAQCRADGTLQELEDIWFGSDEDRKVVDMSGLTGVNGTVRVITTSTDMPFSYIKNNKNVGYDIDLVVRFCRDRGYRLELGDVDFSGRIPAVTSGKYDFTTDMNVTPERAEEVLFSDPTSTGGVVLAVKSEDLVNLSAADSDPAPAGISSLSQLAGKSIGVQTGTIAGPVAQKSLPDIRLSYYNSLADLITALKAGKIDALCTDEPMIRYMLIENPDIWMVPELFDHSSLAAVFPKSEAGQALCSQYSSFVESLWADGTMDEITGIWFGADDSKRVVMDYESLPDTNGTLRMALDTSLLPFAYIKDNRVVGYDVDIAARFCQANGYRLETVQMSFDGVLAAVQTGKCDFAACGITVTDERKESVLFSSENYKSGTAAAVMKTGKKQDASFWDDLIESFTKTFLREDRWMLFLEGVGTTLLITVLAVLFGTALGFGVFMLCRNGNPLTNGVTRFCMWLVQGMPMVVLMMILYYVVFGSVSIQGVAVAVIGFTLTFGSSVYGLVKMGVGAVDNGQYEAACALGYSNRSTFFRIILPQALPHVLSAYKGEIVGLIKATSIVGYIAVQDLTKMGDIVRSRTYEAFFPLIAVTVIYFLLEGLIGLLVSRISINLDPKRRKPADILKGVNTDD